MVRRPVLSSLTLVALLITLLCIGCAKEEPPLPTTAAQPRPGAPGSASVPAPVPSLSTSEVTQQQRVQQAMQAFQNQTIHFDFDTYDLRPDARAILESKAAFLHENGSIRTQIEGHCDERGTSAYNMVLGERRAHAAKQYLATAGVNAARLSTISYGKERPLDPGHNAAAWAKNRRDTFVVTAP